MLRVIVYGFMNWMTVISRFYLQSKHLFGWAIGVAVTDKISSENKFPTILAGVAGDRIDICCC